MLVLELGLDLWEGGGGPSSVMEILVFLCEFLCSEAPRRETQSPNVSSAGCPGQLAEVSLAGVCVMAAPPAVPAAEWESPSCLRCLPEPEPEPEPWSQLGHLECVYVLSAVDQLGLFG